MPKRWMNWLMVVMACVAVVILATPLESLAQASAPPAPPAASPGNGIDPPADCDGFVGVTHRIAGCIRVTIDEGAQRFFDNVYPGLQRAIGGVLTLAIVIYGVMISYGLVEKVGRDTFVLLLKIAAVVYFVTSSPFMFRTVIGAMDAAAAAVISYSPPSGAADNAGSDYNQSVCMQAMVAAQAAANGSLPSGSNPRPVITPWLGIDCLIDSVIGIKILPSSGNTAPTGSGEWFNKTYADTDASTQGDGPARGLLFFFFSSLQSSVTGGLLAVVGFFFVYGMLSLIVRCFFVYIAGYMGVALLVILSPLFLPMILFKETKQYFDKWAKMFIGFAMQPVIMLVFIIFSLTAVDLAAFSGNYSIVYQIAGDASRTAPFSLNKYLTVKRNASGAEDPNCAPSPECKPIIGQQDRRTLAIQSTPRLADANTIPPIASRDLGGIADNLTYSQCTQANLDAAQAGLTQQQRDNGVQSPLKQFCDAQYNIRVTLKSIDWERLAAARQPPVANVTPTGNQTPAQAAGQQIARQVIAAVFFCVMVVFVLNSMLAVIPRIISDLVGDALQSADLNSIFIGERSRSSSGGLTGNISSAISGIAGRRASAPTRGG